MDSPVRLVAEGMWGTQGLPSLSRCLSLKSVDRGQVTTQSLTVEPTGQGTECLKLSPSLTESPCVSSKLPYDVTTEQALTYPEVKNKLEASIENLRKVTDKVLNSIISSLDLLP